MFAQWMGRSIRRWSVAARRGGAGCARIVELVARLDQELTEIVREADDEDDWRSAGCSSSAQWVAQLCRSDHRTAERITSTGEALRALPAIDRAMSTGELTLDQAAAAAKHATPETDAEIARIAVGKAPSEIALAVRTLVPPKVADDQELYARRSLSMTWTRNRRELVFGGRLPLEQGAAFEQAIWNIAKQQRALDKQAGTILDWHQSTADALVTLAENRDTGRRRQAEPHHADRAPQRRRTAHARGRRRDQRRDCRAPHLRRTPPRHQATRARSRALTRGPLRLLPAATCAARALSAQCQYPGCTATRELQAHHIVANEHGGVTELANLILLCSRHHKLLHDHHIRTSGNGETPVFEDRSGRAITSNQPHAPPG